MQSFRKTNAVSEIFKDGPQTDGSWTDKGDYIGPPWINRGQKLGQKHAKNTNFAPPESQVSNLASKYHIYFLS